MGSRKSVREEVKLNNTRRQQSDTSGGMGLMVPTKAMLKQGFSNYPTTPHQDYQEASTSSKGYRGATGSSSGNKSQYASPAGVHPQQTCCIIDQNQRCHQYVGIYEYTKKMQEMVRSTTKLKLKADYRARHIGICDYHKIMIEGAVNNQYSIDRKKQRNSDSDDTESNEGDEIESKMQLQEIDFSRFPLATLQKYKKYFAIPGQLSKGMLAQAVTSHFKTIPVITNEKDIVMDFIVKVKFTENLENLSDR